MYDCRTLALAPDARQRRQNQFGQLFAGKSKATLARLKLSRHRARRRM